MHCTYKATKQTEILDVTRIQVFYFTNINNLSFIKPPFSHHLKEIYTSPFPSPNNYAELQ
jgi:hypothetical protein